MRITERLGQFRKKLTTKRLLIIAGVLVLGFFLVNVLVFMVFQSKAYPRTIIGQLPVGWTSYSEISASLTANPQLSEQVKISALGKSETVNTSDLGISSDAEKTIANIKEGKSLLPVFDLFNEHRVGLALELEKQKLQSETQRLASYFSIAEKDAKILLNKGIFTLTTEQEGLKINAQEIATQVLTAVSAGKSAVGLSGEKLNPKITAAELKDSYESLKSQQNTSLSYSYPGSSVTPTPSVIASWYASKGNSYEPSDAKIKSYLQSQTRSWGITADNLDDAISQTKKSLQVSKKLVFTITGKKIVRTYSYCVDLKNVSSSNLAQFKSKVASVYADSRGWSLGGRVVFNEASTGCNFTIWLSAASQMSSFGAICDSMWSCRVGRNVVINFDRWKGASSAWNNAGGSLNDYRSMVINHETGHWLGFGHLNCSGVGKPAPVMQQQSIDLQGCKFNPWPTSAELQRFRTNIF